MVVFYIEGGHSCTRRVFKLAGAATLQSVVIYAIDWLMTLVATIANSNLNFNFNLS